jgi:ubiquinone/menaquinone biosynthesis C-methylase UbiE
MSRFVKEEFFMPEAKSGVLYTFLKTFFHELYHRFAWIYDIVAYFVSLGKWQSWVKNSLQFLEGEKILELGYGPGHLQIDLAVNGYIPFGIDESMYMARQAQHRFNRSFSRLSPASPPRLVRGVAETLPFADDSFDSIVATFPTEYIFNSTTLNEIMRVVKPDGKLVVLLSARPVGSNLIDKANLLLFRWTQQIPPQDVDLKSFVVPFTKAGVPAETRLISINKSELLYIISTKPRIHPIESEIAPKNILI